MAGFTVTVPMRLKVRVIPKGYRWRLRLVVPLLWLAQMISGVEFELTGKMEK